MAGEIPLKHGLVALIDDDDYGLIQDFSWYVRPSWKTTYAVGEQRIDGQLKRIRMHRLIMNAPQGIYVDHINGNGLDNRRSNLRLASHAENLWNGGRKTTNTSGWKGIYCDKSRGYWYAELHANGKRFRSRSLGCAEDAARAYDDLARIHHREFARVNFPTDGEQAA